jgi:hypothetical protein
MEMVPEVFKQLQQALETAQQEGDFPDWLALVIQTIVRRSGSYAGRECLIRILIGQIRDYDPYAGCGCFSDSCGISDLERTLNQLGRDRQEEIK